MISFFGAGLNHDEAVFGPGDDEIQRASLALLVGRVDHVLSVDLADAHASDRLLERDARQRERGGGAGQCQHIRVVVGVCRQHERDNLRLVAPARRKQRTDRPIDHAARQHFLFGRLAFALEKSARDAARCVGVFLVVDRQRKKVDALARVRRRAGGDENDRVALANEDRTVGLFRQLAGLEGNRSAVDINFAFVHVCLGKSFGDWAMGDWVMYDDWR